MASIDYDGEADLRNLLWTVRRRKWVIFAVALAVIALSVALSLRQTPQYRASAELLLRGSEAESRLDNPTGQIVRDPARVDTEIGVLESRLVRSRVSDVLGRRPSVSARSQPNTDIITVSSTSTDPDVAAETVNVYLDVYIQWKRESTVNELLEAQQVVQSAIADLRDQLDELEKPIADLETALFVEENADSAEFLRNDLADLREETQPERDALNSQIVLFQSQLSQLQVSQDVTTTGGVQVISAAEPPESPFSPQPLRNGVLGLVVGAMLGVGLAFLLETLDDRVRSKDDLERATGWTAIGLIPKFDTQGGTNELVSLTDPTSTAAEAYRALRTAVQFLGIERNLKIILVTSAKPADGKTTVVANLAVAMSRTGQRVAVIDADLRRPRLHKVFDVPNDVGFTSIMLRTKASDDAAIHRLDDLENLVVITAGPPPPNPSELLSLSRTRDFLQHASSECDILIIDSPPLLPVSDALVLSQYADGVIVVASATGARQRELGRAAELLHQVDAPVLGVVANGVTSADGYGYDYDYDYGYDYRTIADPDAAPDEAAEKLNIFT